MGKILVGLGVEAKPQSQLSIVFLRKLDPKRFGEMYHQLLNNSSAGVAMPVTVQAAYNIATNWKIKDPNGSSRAVDGMQHVFVTADGWRKPEPVQQQQQQQEQVTHGAPRPKGGDMKKKGVTFDKEPAKEDRVRSECYICRSTEHKLRQCPFNTFPTARLIRDPRDEPVVVPMAPVVPTALIAQPNPSTYRYGYDSEDEEELWGVKY